MSWFRINGVGERALEEQMRGVTPLLAEAAGKRVLDLGCAEGLIAFEFARAGAFVYACDFNAQLVETASRIKPKGLAIELEVKSVQNLVREKRSFDVVLALAILHKLAQPRACMKWISGTGASLVAVRLPRNSTGFFRSKHRAVPCNVNKTMTRLGYRLDKALPGPRGELVQHWRR